MNPPAKLLERREIIILSALLLVAVIIRLINISQPFIDAWTWKQTTVAMIAENFYRNGFNIFYPQINWVGTSPGYIGTEFPLVHFIASIFYLIFGVREWIGRSISVFFFAASVPFLYLLVKKVSNERSAVFTVAIYAFIPFSIFASRSFMSDMPSLALSIVAVHLFVEWLERKGLKLFMASAAATSIAILLKPSAVIIGLPMLYVAWERYGVRLILRRELWAFAAIVLVFPSAWYLLSYLKSYWYPPYMLGARAGLHIVSWESYGLILKRISTLALTPLVFIAMLGGIFLPHRRPLDRVFHWWLAAMILFIFFAGSGGNRHPWYQLPLIPVAAALAGGALDFLVGRSSKLTRTRTLGFCACMAFFAALCYLSYIYVNPLYAPWATHLWKAGLEVDRITPPDALVVFVDGGDSTGLYYSRRRGWHALHSIYWGDPIDSRDAITQLEALRKDGASYLIFISDKFWWLTYYKEFRNHLDSFYQRLRETDDYIIFDLTASVAREP